MTLFQFILFFAALTITIAFHEFCHAWVANRFGDPTPKYYGRLTLNPLAHLDLIGTIMLFVAHIGWGKPVPINPDNFKHPKRDSALVALAGPASNFVLAFLTAIPFKYFSNISEDSLVAAFFGLLFELSIALGVFNLLPFPPLDGSKVLGLFIPKRFHRSYDHYLEEGMTYFVVFLLVDNFFIARTFNFSFISSIVGTLTDAVRYVILLGT